MPHLLRLDSSADREHSRSRSITHTFAEAWRSVSPQHSVQHRDLHIDPPPHLVDVTLHWPRRLRPSGSAEHPAAEALQQTLLAELLAADVLLVGAPMYNYSVPSTLKAWLDYIRVPGVTAPFDGPTQPLKGRPAVIVASRGGAYDPGTPSASWDHGVPMLKLVLGHALGMNVSVIATNLTSAGIAPALADQQERAATDLAAAHRHAAEAGRTIGESLAAMR